MELPKRKPIRLPDYDYSTPGAYFVTICTKDRKCILSNLTVGADALGGPLRIRSKCLPFHRFTAGTPGSPWPVPYILSVGFVKF